MIKTKLIVFVAAATLGLASSALAQSVDAGDTYGPNPFAHSLNSGVASGAAVPQAGRFTGSQRRGPLYDVVPNQSASDSGFPALRMDREDF
jgi:hypothetical protein